MHHNAIHKIPKGIISLSLSPLGASLYFRETQTIVAEMCEFIFQYYFNVNIQFIVSYKLHIEICSSLRLHFVFCSMLFIPYPTAFPYGNGMVLHFYQQQESSTTKTVHKVINKGLKTYV